MVIDKFMLLLSWLVVLLIGCTFLGFTSRRREKKVLRCVLLGHLVVGSKHKDSQYTRYFEIASVATDGIDREHAYLYTECSRCGEKFFIGVVHLPKKDKKQTNEGRVHGYKTIQEAHNDQRDVRYQSG